MASSGSARSMTRRPWPEIGVGLAVVGVMVLGAFFVLSAVIAGWVSDLHGSDLGNVSVLGRVNTYEAWLSAASVAAIAAIQVGVGLILFSIVLRLRMRVAGLREALPVFIKARSSSTTEGSPR